MSLKRKQPAWRRQCKPLLPVIALSLFLGACTNLQRNEGVPPGFLGGVVADEPRAAIIGRSILSAGGSAADAAVAAAFAMTATLPSRAGLGGGGMCLMYDPRLNRVEAIDFVARAPAAPSAAATPAMVRGLGIVFGRQGKLRWEQLVAPGEGLARFGAPVSRAFALDLEAAGPALAGDPAARRIFSRPDGALLVEGDTLVQEDLSTVLAAVRSRGAGDLYQGPLADQFVAAAMGAGAGITAADLQAVTATARASALVRYDDIAVHFAPPPAIAGVTSAQAFAMLAPRWRRTSVEERPHLLAEADLRAALDRSRWLTPDMSTNAPLGDLVGSQRIDSLIGSYRSGARATDLTPPAPRAFNPATAGVVAVDREGGGVACSFTLNEMFGLGRVAPGTGMLLAAAPDGATRGPQMLTPVLGAMARTGRIVFASTASGGWPGASAQVQVALRTVVERRPLEESMDFARIYNPGTGSVQAEEALQGPLPGLTARGYSASTVTNLGQVNAIYCPDGLYENAEACQFRADRRGAGFAVGP